MSSKTFYVTTPIYYVNDVPHVGHLYTTLSADILARYHRLVGDEVFFPQGTDEHGAKIAQAAKENGMAPKKYADKMVPEFKKAWKLFNISYDFFIRTTDPRHEKEAQKILQRIYDNGFIYERLYEGLYCIGCEKFLTEKELVNNKCPFHPTKKPIFQKEKNYFFKLSEFNNKLLKAIKNGEYSILPKIRENEIVSKLKQGAEDVSISREGVSWGIPVPWDRKQTIYVWVEALFNYVTMTRFLKSKSHFWPAQVHLMAKDITWFHAVIWPALLLAAEMPLPEKIVAHGFFTLNGEKISKSTGNVISPQELVKIFDVDASRYLLMAEIPFGSDADLSLKRFKERYNADLANGLGNLIARVAKLCEKDFIKSLKNLQSSLRKGGYYSHIEKYEFSLALEELWREMKVLDGEIEQDKPWALSAQERKGKLLLYAKKILSIAWELRPFLPETAEKITKQFKGPKIHSAKPLFPRL
jgi:methionyl-tRNA synthetase